MDDLDEILEEILCKTYSSIVNREDQLLKSMGSLSLKEFYTLDVIYNCQRNSSNTLSNIAKHLGVTLSTCTINIDRLIDKGYLQKVKLNGDKRISYIRLTPSGMSIRKKRDVMHHKIVRMSVAKLSTAEKASLISAITKMDI